MLKHAAFSLLAVLTALTAGAQDTITTTDGDKLAVKVVEITPRVVLYHRSENPGGPQYSISKREVAFIEYENGTQEDFGHRRVRERRDGGSRMGARDDRSYGNNILSLAPVHINNESAAGFGLQYERVLDRRGIVSMYLPLAVSLVREELNYNYPTSPGGFNRGYHPFFHVYPGIKVYPTGSQGVVRYSIGASVDLGFGRKHYDRDIYNSSTGQSARYRFSEDVFKTGVVINNGLNFMPTPRLYIGMEAGIGFYYFNNETDFYNYDINEPAAHFNFKVGYRF